MFHKELLRIQFCRLSDFLHTVYLGIKRLSHCKRLSIIILLTFVIVDGFATPQCPPVSEIQSTQMDFVLAVEGGDHLLPIPTLDFNRNFNFVTLGHLRYLDQSWYVIDGFFNGVNSMSEAQKIGQDFLVYSHEPWLLHKPDTSNIWVCLYQFSNTSKNLHFIIASNGSIEEAQSIKPLLNLIQQR